MNLLAGVHLFVAQVNIQGKPLGNFLQRASRGPYVRIRNQGGTVIISSKTLPNVEVRRKDKRKYLAEDLLALLEAPWPGGRRISYSTEVSNLWTSLFVNHRQVVEDELAKGGLSEAEQKTLLLRWKREENRKTTDGKNEYWAMVQGQREAEFMKLMTPEEQAIWLSGKRSEARIFRKGESFLQSMIPRVEPDSKVILIGKLEEEDLAQVP